MKKIYLVILIGVLSVFTAAAADHYMFKHLEVKDGLSNNLVTSIFKDSRGYMWFGTAAGLNRYDGTRITTYLNYDETGPFMENYINDIQEDREGNLWIGTNSGYSVYDARTDEFSHEIGTLMQGMGMDVSPSLVHIDRYKNMWFYVYGKGIYVHFPEAGKLCSFLYETGFPQGEIQDISECDEGVLFVYNDGRVVCIDGAGERIAWQLEPVLPNGKREAFSIYVDRDNDLWIYSVSYIGIYSIGEKAWLTDLAKKIQQTHTDMVRSVCHSRSGWVWIGHDQHGICVFNKRTGKRLNLSHLENDERSLQNNSVVSLYEDAHGIMWVGTYKKGVSYYSESTFKFGINHVGDVNCVEEDKDGYVWIGTNDEGLARWHKLKGVDKVFKHGEGNSISSNAVVTLKKARDGKLWIGTFKGGLDCYDNGRFIHYRHQEGNSNSLVNDNVFAIDEDKDGHIWIGTLGGGVQCLNPATGKFATYTTKEGLFSDYVSSLQVTDDNQLLIGTAYGLSVFDLGTRRFENYYGTKSGDAEFTNRNLNQVFQDSRGLLWIATREGLNVFDMKADALTILSEEDGLSSQLITGIAEDDNRNIWLATAKGLTNVVTSVDTKTGNYSFRFYTYNDMDGLQNCEFNMRSLKKMSDGELMVGGMYGVNFFQPKDIRYNKVLPKVIFTQLSLFNEEVKVGKKYGKKVLLEQALDIKREVELAYGQNVFSVQFASDNFILPEKMKYAYKLEGFNTDWLVTDVGKVTYTNLSPGTYTLKVKAINSDGFSGNEEAALKIVIRPPFWLTNWAFALYAMLFALVALLARYLMLRSERNKFRMQQIRQEAEKNKEINDMKLRFFTNVSHELRTPLTLILSPMETLMKEHREDASLMNKLDMMHRNALRLLSLVNQLLDFRRGDEKGHRLNVSEGDIVSFTNNICNSFSDMTEKKHVYLTFFSAVPVLNMSFDSDKYNKIVMNLLSNAFKFTPEGGRVDVSLNVVKNETGEEMLDLKVADTGIGIKNEDKEHIFERFYQAENKAQDVTGSGVGLSLVSDFVRLHGGTVEVMDNAPTGSVFIVHIPIRTHQGECVQQADEHPEELAMSSEPQTVMEPELPVGDNRKAEKEEEAQLPIALVVDDSEDFLTYMKDTFGKDYRIKTALNGRIAWDMMKEQLPDIIICDVMMPELDGNQLCKLVKGDKRTSGIPFILLTSCQSKEHKLEGLTEGADDYITKPFSVDILALRIKKLIGLHASARQRALIDPSPSEIVITSLDEKLIDRAVKFVEDNIARTELSVEELSAALGMSRVHLYKKMVAITGKTPIEFIRIIRLKRAAQLLRESQQNVSEIAYQVGFNNPKYFSKYFKDEFGVLPSTYQKTEGK